MAASSISFRERSANALDRRKSWDCSLGEATTTTPAASMTSSQLTHHRPWSPILWTCGVISMIAPATGSAGGLTIRSETCHRYICADFIPNSRTLGSSGHTRRGSTISSLALQIQTILVLSLLREELRGAAVSVYKM